MKYRLQKIAAFFMPIVRRSFIQYDVKICYFSVHEIEEEQILIQMQKEGWEICGQIGVPQKREWVNEKSVTVPMKRRRNYA